MAVLIEAISVVMRADALLRRFGGDWEAFKRSVPNGTLCADGELVRVGFMHPADVREYVRMLEPRGLRYLEGGKAQDIVVVDQRSGPLTACDWVEFGHVNLGNDPDRRVAACRLVGSTIDTVATPDGWTFASSLSKSFRFHPGEDPPPSLRLLRHENGVDVYWDDKQGKEVFIARNRGGGR